MKFKDIKIIVVLFLITLAVIVIALFGSYKAAFGQTVPTLDQWIASSTPSANITQRIFGRTLKITGLSDGCLGLSSSLVVSSGSACGSGGGSSFPTSTAPLMASWFVATSTNATSTFAGMVSIGTDSLDVLTNGKVGIGTPIPQTTLEVSSGNTTGLIVSNNTGNRNVDTPALEFRAINGANFGGSKILSTYSGNGTGDHFLDFFNTHLGASTLFMRLTDIGRLGLGTSTPGTDLSLGDASNFVNISTSGTSTFSTGININTGCYAIGQVCIGSSGGTVNSGIRGMATFYDANGTAVSGTTTLVFGTTTADANNVGIGSTTPLSRLSVSRVGQSSGDLFTIASTTQANMFRVAGNGYVGIGATTSLSAALSIRTAAASFSNTAFIIKNPLVGDTSNSFTIKENGQTGIGTAPNSSYMLNVGGAVNASGDICASAGTLCISTLHDAVQATGAGLAALSDTVTALSAGVWTPDGMGNIAWNTGYVSMFDAGAGSGHIFFNNYGIGTNIDTDTGTLYIGSEAVDQTMVWVSAGGALGTSIVQNAVNVGHAGNGTNGTLNIWDDDSTQNIGISAGGGSLNFYNSGNMGNSAASFGDLTTSYTGDILSVDGINGTFDWASGALHVANSGSVSLSSLTASKPVFTDGSKNLVSGSFSVPQIATTSILTTRGADIASTNYLNTSVAGLYRISYTLEDTSSDITAGAVTVTFAYTDAAGAATQASTPVVLTTAGRTQGVIFVQLASGSVSFSTSHTGIFGTSKYNLYATVEKMF